MRFAGKICVVTGGGSGIGRATCHRLADEGGQVAVLDVDEETAKATAKVITDAGGQALHVRVDVSEAKAVRSAVEAVVARWQRIDVLVNCAAKMTFEPVVYLEEADWDGVIATNLRSVFLLSKYCLPHMRRGAIVNISSVHAHQTTANVAPYAASKGGIEAFTRALSRECEERDVRVNSVAPGAVETPMLRSNPLVQSGEEKIQGKIGEPEEIAAAIAFLASDEAGFINGTTLAVDGGRLTIL
jgi:glucose 1-dehydrogenase